MIGKTCVGMPCVAAVMLISAASAAGMTPENKAIKSLASRLKLKSYAMPIMQTSNAPTLDDIYQTKGLGSDTAWNSARSVAKPENIEASPNYGGRRQQPRDRAIMKHQQQQSPESPDSEEWKTDDDRKNRAGKVNNNVYKVYQPSSADNADMNDENVAPSDDNVTTKRRQRRQRQPHKWYDSPQYKQQKQYVSPSPSPSSLNFDDEPESFTPSPLLIKFAESVAPVDAFSMLPGANLLSSGQSPFGDFKSLKKLLKAFDAPVTSNIRQQQQQPYEQLPPDSANSQNLVEVPYSSVFRVPTPAPRTTTTTSTAMPPAQQPPDYDTTSSSDEEQSDDEPGYVNNLDQLNKNAAHPIPSRPLRRPSTSAQVRKRNPYRQSLLSQSQESAEETPFYHKQTSTTSRPTTTTQQQLPEPDYEQESQPTYDEPSRPYKQTSISIQPSQHNSNQQRFTDSNDDNAQQPFSNSISITSMQSSPVSGSHQQYQQNLPSSQNNDEASEQYETETENKYEEKIPASPSSEPNAYYTSQTPQPQPKPYASTAQQQQSPYASKPYNPSAVRGTRLTRPQKTSSKPYSQEQHDYASSVAKALNRYPNIETPHQHPTETDLRRQRLQGDAHKIWYVGDATDSSSVATAPYAPKPRPQVQQSPYGNEKENVVNNSLLRLVRASAKSKQTAYNNGAADLANALARYPSVAVPHKHPTETDLRRMRLQNEAVSHLA